MRFGMTCYLSCITALQMPGTDQQHTRTQHVKICTPTNTHPHSIAVSIRVTMSAGEREALGFLGAEVTLPSDHTRTHGV